MLYAKRLTQNVVYALRANLVCGVLLYAFSIFRLAKVRKRTLGAGENRQLHYQVGTNWFIFSKTAEGNGAGLAGSETGVPVVCPLLSAVQHLLTFLPIPFTAYSTGLLQPDRRKAITRKENRYLITVAYGSVKVARSFLFTG